MINEINQEEETNMKKSCLWRKMTSGLMAAAVTVTAMPGLGLTMVQAEEKKTLKVAMECSYAPDYPAIRE